jgi:hypothetical protein
MATLGLDGLLALQLLAMHLADSLVAHLALLNGRSHSQALHT